MPIPPTNSTKHEQPATQSGIPMSTTLAVNKTPSNTEVNDTKTTPMTLHRRPSTTNTTEDSVSEINPEAIKRDKKHMMPMKPENHSSPQSTRQPVLPKPQVSRQLLLPAPPESAKNKHYSTNAHKTI